jgi:hypothetical protein
MCPLWCVCTSPAASRLTAVATALVWRAAVSAQGASGGVRPATSWTAAPPTAAGTGCAQRVSGGSGGSGGTLVCPALPCLPPHLASLSCLVLAAGCRCDSGWTGSNCSEGKSHQVEEGLLVASSSLLRRLSHRLLWELPPGSWLLAPGSCCVSCVCEFQSGFLLPLLQVPQYGWPE